MNGLLRWIDKPDQQLNYKLLSCWAVWRVKSVIVVVVTIVLDGVQDILPNMRWIPSNLIIEKSIS